MKAFKGFNKDLTCRGYQYEEGKEFHTDKAKCCEEGFHACEHPLDVLNYYSPNISVFHEVELSGDIDRRGADSKVCATDIKIGARLTLAGLVKCAIDFTMSRVKKEAGSNKDYGASSATGDYGASSATGNCGASSATGDYGASSATGYKGASSATGNCGASSATGDYGASSATGDYGASSATGNYGASSATGNCGASSATGYKGASSVSDPTGVAVAWGHEARAKGCLGAHLILSDWEYTGKYYSDGDPVTPYNKDSWKLNGAKLVIVDGEKVRADTYYRCINGEIVEVDENGNPIDE